MPRDPHLLSPQHGSFQTLTAMWHVYQGGLLVPPNSVHMHLVLGDPTDLARGPSIFILPSVWLGGIGRAHATCRPQAIIVNVCPSELGYNSPARKPRVLLLETIVHLAPVILLTFTANLVPAPTFLPLPSPPRSPLSHLGAHYDAHSCRRGRWPRFPNRHKPLPGRKCVQCRRSLENGKFTLAPTHAKSTPTPLGPPRGRSEGKKRGGCTDTLTKSRDPSTQHTTYKSTP